MQYLFLVILIGALGVGMVVLTWMGLAQRARRRLLARTADEMGLKFSAADLFHLTQRYPGFVLADAGHSPRAENVLYGRYEGWNLRAFDFWFEAGHGPRRVARRYSVLAAEANVDIPPALIWHAGDNEHTPLAARSAAGRVGPWRVVAGAALAPRLAEAFGPLAGEPLNVQTLGRSIILCSPAVWKAKVLPDRIRQAVAALEVLRAGCGAA